MSGLVYVWSVSHDQFEGSLFRGGVGPEVVCVLCQGKPA